MKCLNLFLLASFLLISLLPSQKLRGKVVDKLGKPRVGAEVILVSPGIPHALKPEVLRARTNKRGRFHATLSPGRRYWAWSHFTAQNGGCFSSRIVEPVEPGQVLILKDQFALFPRRVHFEGLFPWGKPGDLRLLWDLDGREGLTMEVPIDSKGNASVPPEAPLRPNFPNLVSKGDPSEIFALRFVLQTKTGKALFEGNLLASPSKGKMSLSDLIQMATTIPGPISCPKPLELPLVLEEDSTQKPIAGVRAYTRFGLKGHWLEGPLSDAQGRLLLKVPDFLKTSYNGLSISLVKSGFAGCTAHLQKTQSRVEGKLRPFDSSWFKKGLKLFLKKDQVFTASVLSPKGKGLKGAVLRFRPRIVGWLASGRDRWEVTDKEGRALANSLPFSLQSLEASLYLSPPNWNSLVGSSFPFAPPKEPLLKLAWKPEQNMRREFEFDLALYHVLPFQAVGPDGAPIPYPLVSWASFEDKAQRAIPGKGGRMGRGFLLVPRGKVCLFGQAKGALHVILDQIKFPEGGDFVLPERKLVFKQIETVLAGRVVDKDGKPIQGASITIVNQLENPFARSPRTSAVRFLNQVFFKGKTDKEGRFSIPFLEDSALEMMLIVKDPGPPSKFRILRRVLSQKDLEIVLR